MSGAVFFLLLNKRVIAASFKYLAVVLIVLLRRIAVFPE